jgi:hypothetical protein
MKILWLQRILLGLIAAASLYASVGNLNATADLGRIAEDPVADWEVRFEPLRARLPFVRGVVGYLSDSGVPGVTYDKANDEGEYILTQYALAPIIIVWGTDQEWNVANLSAEAYRLWSAQEHNEFDIRALGRGLYLLHRTAN